MTAILIGIIVGAVSTFHASINNRIRELIGSAYTTSVMNFVVAGLLVTAVILITEHGMYIPLRTIAQHPFWIWCGGVCGTAIVTLNVLCLPKLGSARNVMIICFGQVMTGLIIDHAGLFYSPAVPMTLMRTAGAVLVLTGTLMVNGIGRDREDDSSGELLYVILALICGFACSAQIAFNGALKEVIGSAPKATLISMIGGFISSLLLILIITVVRGPNGIYDDPEVGRPPFRFRPFMVLGGLFAVLIVGGNAVIADALGTGLVTILNLIGMMGAGLIIDAAGFLGIEKKPVTALKIAGMLLMTGGTAMISLL